MSQIVLDAEAFKALSSDTRLQILKALDARRLTVSEMGRLLALNKATVFEHLKQLAGAGLVKKEDEGRKWVYYKLTWKGRNVLHPENVQFMLLLGTAALSVGGLVFQLGNLFAWWAGSGAGGAVGNAPGGGAPGGAPAQPEDASQGQPTATTAASGPAPMFGDEAKAPAVGRDGSGTEWLSDPNVWLVALLALVLLLTSLLAARYLLERRRERAPVLHRIRRLPPPEPDA